MSRMASILAYCVVASIFSLDAWALPDSPVLAQMAASEVTLATEFCWPGFHLGPHGGCASSSEPPGYVEAQVFGLPYIAPPAFGLPYIGPPAVGLPYIGPPVVGLPYIGPREYVSPRACPYRYLYNAGRCVPT
jgi:hypothetical protein